MADRERRRLAFGEVADLYDRVRPGYPAAVFDDIADLAGLEAGAHVLEVGCGTGRATVEFVKLGFDVVALEPHPSMARIARSKVETGAVVPTSFEDWRPAARAFGLVAAAQAWHWVDPDIGFAKAAGCLTPQGWIALFWNWLIDDRSELREQLDRIYRRSWLRGRRHRRTDWRFPEGW